MAHKKPLKLEQLYTRWGKALNADMPLPEHPRPQFMRENWQNLNGRWEYKIAQGAITEAGAPQAKAPDAFEGEIIVPFSPESLLSGVGRQLQPGQTLWYRRAFSPDALRKTAGEKGHVLLHFGAVDQTCFLYVNGAYAGMHVGGYFPFSFDITGFLKPGGGPCAIALAVTDDTAEGPEAWGKQSLARGGIWYTAQSGIWQTVWAEAVPEQSVESVKITPLYDESAVVFELCLAGLEPVLPVGAAGGTQHTATQIAIYDGETLVVKAGTQTGKAKLRLPGFKSWSPDEPFLYDVVITCGGDEVKSYFGMRKFGVAQDGEGHWRTTLNGEPIFQTGLLDQGYWSDGLYTPPADEAMVWEIGEMKSLGFNMLRKHIKIEPMRWYYHCDRLGMLVWQDMVSGGAIPYNPFVIHAPLFLPLPIPDNRYRLFGREDKLSRERFEDDMRATVDALYNVTSLCEWTVFNEGWGQFDAADMTRLLHRYDDTRPIDHASGWYDQGAGVFCSHHAYYKPFRLRKDKYGRVQALTEFGGYSLPAKGHMASKKLFGYKVFHSKGEFAMALKRLYEGQIIPAAKKGLSIAIYTQVSDVEDEINGLLTYDREVCKADPALLQALNEKLKQAVK